MTEPPATRPPSPLAAFKAAWRQQQEAAGAPARAAAAELLGQLSARLAAVVGPEVMAELDVALASSEPPVLTVTAARHVPVQVHFDGVGSGTDGGLRFAVRVGTGRQVFDHLGAALHRGQPRLMDDAVNGSEPAPAQFSTVRPLVVRRNAGPAAQG